MTHQNVVQSKSLNPVMEVGSLRENPDMLHTVNKDPRVSDLHSSNLLASVIKKQSFKLKSESCTGCRYKLSEMR